MMLSCIDNAIVREYLLLATALYQLLNKAVKMQAKRRLYQHGNGYKAEKQRRESKINGYNDRLSLLYSVCKVVTID